MSKLLKMKEWVTIGDAARHLQQIFDEMVNEADIYQLALDGHIRLTADFPNHVKARLGRVVSYKNVPIKENLLSDEDNPITYVDGYLLNSSEVVNEESSCLVFDEDVVSIGGLWDLSMVGSERMDIQQNLQNLIGGPAITSINIEGAFLNRADGTWASLQESFKEQKIEDGSGKSLKFSGGYYPASGLGESCNLVIRVSELVSFQARFSEKNLDKSLGLREEVTYLNIIGGLLNLMLTTTPGGQKISQFTSQSAVIDALEIHYPGKQGLKRSTLEQKFSQAKRSILAS